MVGRNREVQELNDLYESSKAELVAIYGRRRVGKTYLVDETFKDRITFRHAGLSPVEHDSAGFLHRQLEHFYYSLLSQGVKIAKKPKSWLEAFFVLEQYLDACDTGERQIVFLDELPWLDTPRSGFMTAFEAFWNSWGCHRKNLMVIVCGSANSWVIDNLINNHGGLYDRVTYVIKLEPFTLRECERFFQENNVRLSRYDIAQSYMICGGIPYYLGYFRPGSSLAQNVDELFFVSHAKLADEYDRLFCSVFDNPGLARSVVEYLSVRKKGYAWNEIACGLGISTGGALSETLKALAASNFIEKYTLFGESARKPFYRLVDPFCWFYLKFVKGRSALVSNFWQQNQSMPAVTIWRGLAFENVCFCHIEQIKKALGIVGVDASPSAWVCRDEEGEGVQVDMILDRGDNIINMCEAKFYNDLFTVNGSYHRRLMHRENVLSEVIPRRKTIRHTLISTFGLKKNEYSSIFSNVITLDDLFA